MSNMNKSPPLLSKSKSHDDWLILVEIWRKFTTLEPEKQGPAIVLSLEGEAQDAVSELDTNQISRTDGVAIIIDRLNKIYKKDELTQKYNALEAFETYKRKPTLSIRDFLTEFEKRYHKTKSYGTQISDDVLAYTLLKSANLSTRDEQLVKATITELKYDSVKSKLIKIFSDNNDIPTPDFNNMHIKTEPVYHAQSYPEVNTFAQTHFDNEDTEYQTDYINENDVEHQDEYHTLHAQNTKTPPRMKNNQRTLQRNTYQFPNYQQQNYYQQSQRPHQIQTNQTNTNWRNTKTPTLRKRHLKDKTHTKKMMYKQDAQFVKASIIGLQTVQTTTNITPT